MAEKIRKTGIDVIGDAPWGTHFCLFYHTKEDLIDVLVPYFKAGLENNEFCMWVTSEPLEVEDAKTSLKKVVGNLDDYIEKGQIEILDYSQWYTKSGRFEANKVLQGWVEKEDQALKRGFDGLRLTGNTFWLEKRDWRSFTNYEEQINNRISKYRMIGVCTYPLDKCGASEVIDVVSNHQFALIKQAGKWELIESTERKRVEEELINTKQMLENITQGITEGILLLSKDFRILWANNGFLDQSGYKMEEILGNYCYKVTHHLESPCQPPHHPCPCYEVKKTGKPLTMVHNHFDQRGNEFFVEVSAYPIMDEKGEIIQFVHLSRDITERKKAEEALRKAHDELEQRVEERTAKLVKANEQLRREIEDRKRAEEALKRSEASLAEAQRIAHLGNWDWNIVTNELQWSDEIYRIFGLSPQEFGATYEAFLDAVHPNDREFVQKAVNETIYEHAPYSINHRIIRPDSNERNVHEEGEVFFDESGKPIRMIGTVHDITERKQAEEVLQESEKELRFFSSQLLTVKEQERKRIVRELHDGIGQSLTAIKFGVERALEQMGKSRATSGVESLEATIPVIQDAIEEVRRIGMDLRPSTLDDLGILATISWLCREFQTIYSGITIEKQIDIQEDEVPDHLKTVIYRVLQEAFNNVAKHSKADLVSLYLRKTDGSIELEIKDNGLGFDPEDALSVESSKRGFGLASMRERTELSGGSFAIESVRGAGTIVRASWPLQE